MRAGILTFHKADNYGAVLQAYALTEWLRQNGVEPEIVDYRSRVYDKYELFRKKLYRKAPYMLGVDLLKYCKKKKRSRAFQAFRNVYLPVSERSYAKADEIKEDQERYDYYICGSDQVWNPSITRGIDPVYFLDFVLDEKKKIAYAPSVALSRLTEFEIARMIGYMSTFSALSIREQETIDLMQPYCPKPIVQVCDPVFLLKPESYDSLCSDCHAKERFVFLYVVGKASNYTNVISYAERFAQEKHIKLFFLIDGDKTLYRIKGKNVYGCSPQDFLSLIRNADCVISNSFHATAFSILFSKQFYTFLKDATGSRMVNLLHAFQLEDRIINNECFEGKRQQIIDYSQIDRCLGQFRRDSVSYLRHALGMASEGEWTEDTIEIATREQNRKELFEFVEWRKNAWLVRHKDRDVVGQSRSGGVFTALSDTVLAEGGVVYGCEMENVSKAAHHRATSAEERDRMRGSKYLQSDMGDCFRRVREDLAQQRTVLFSGTGCQTAGLRNYLKDMDLSRLYTVDIICHGVPSIRLWEAYLDWMTKKHGEPVDDVDFRNKRFGWKAHFETVKIGGRIYASSVYKKLFLKNAFLRPSCYECPFSTLHRGSDITIGDAWGINAQESQFNDDKGCSIVLINSEKGESLFEKSGRSIQKEHIDLEDYLQPNLYQPSSRPADRQEYWECLGDYGFGELARKYCMGNVVSRFAEGRKIRKAGYIRQRV